jgi:hypothetical protein
VNHVRTPAPNPSAPPPTATPSDLAPPRWQNLTPTLQQLLIAQLTRMLLQHLPAPGAAGGKGVPDDTR